MRLWLLFMLAAFCHALGEQGQTKSAVAASPKTVTSVGEIAEAKKLRDSGHFREALELSLRVARVAEQTGDQLTAAKALNLGAGAEVSLFQYRNAIQHFGRAADLAKRAADKSTQGIATANIAVIYYQLGDFNAANRTLSESLTLLKDSTRPELYALALVNEGKIAYGLGHAAEGKSAFNEALAVSRKIGAPALEATVEDNLGILQVLSGELPSAEHLLLSAADLRSKAGTPSEVAVTQEHLAEFYLAKGKPFLPEALKHINAALAKRQDLSSDALYYPLHVKGQIELGLGQAAAALHDFRHAVQEADNWRQSALPGDATNTRTAAQLNSVYQDCADLLASQAVSEHSHVLAEEAFGIIARSRAATLREQLTQSRQDILLQSPEYFALLQKLQEAQATVTLASSPAKAEENRKNLDRIRADLSDLENRLGLGSRNLTALSEKNSYRNLLATVQSRLSPSQVILSFSLGATHSYLWAVTRAELQIFALPDRNVIDAEVRAVREAVHSSDQTRTSKGASTSVSGLTLSQSLFGSLSGPFLKKSEWMISADGDLLDKMPFSALPSPKDPGRLLIADHSLRILPSEILTAIPSKKAKTERFIGVGDPIYNRADARWKRTAPQSAFGSDVRPASLARLVGSDRELRSAAEASRLPQVVLLTGQEASGTTLREATATPPQILHFAVHVLSPERRPGEAALALSLTRANIPELLTAETVASYRVPGSLVVLSGCASQQGEIVPGSGLIGLSRSWLLAGADAVIVSAWPTPDDSGQFFSTFYRYYAGTPGSVAGRAAVALQRTQLAMRDAGGYRGDPSFWAAYSIVSKE